MFRVSEPRCADSVERQEIVSSATNDNVTAEQFVLVDDIMYFPLTVEIAGSP